MVVIPETLYNGLLASSATSTNPHDKQIQTSNEKISQILADNNLPADTKTILYNQEIRQVKNLQQQKPEAQVERSNQPLIESVEQQQLTTPNISLPRASTPQQTLEFPPLSPIPSEHPPPADLHVDETQLNESQPWEIVTSQKKKSKKSKVEKKKKSEAEKKTERLQTAKPSTQLESKAAKITETLLKTGSTRLPITAKGEIKNNSGNIITGAYLIKNVKFALEKPVGQRAPNGYSHFIFAIKQHPDLYSLIEQQQQEGSGKKFVFRPKKWKKF